MIWNRRAKINNYLLASYDPGVFSHFAKQSPVSAFHSTRTPSGYTRSVKQDSPNCGEWFPALGYDQIATIQRTIPDFPGTESSSPAFAGIIVRSGTASIHDIDEHDFRRWCTFVMRLCPAVCGGEAIRHPRRFSDWSVLNGGCFGQIAWQWEIFLAAYAVVLWSSFGRYGDWADLLTDDKYVVVCGHCPWSEARFKVPISLQIDSQRGETWVELMAFCGLIIHSLQGDFQMMWLNKLRAQYHQESISQNFPVFFEREKKNLS